jgi:tetratricopeptide (TPR) repeat protein
MASMTTTGAVKWSSQVARDRKLFETSIRKGAVYLDNELWTQAFGAYRAAIKESPKEPLAYAGLAEACFGLKRLDRALELYKVAARYSRGDIYYLKKVADIQERLGQLEAAGRTYMAIGEIHLRRRELDDAVSHWQRAVRLEPGLLGTHRRLAMVYQRQNDVRSAVREYLAIARILQMQGNKKKALQMCRAALRLDPDNDDVLRALDLIRSGPEAFVEPEPQEPEVTEVAVPADEMGSLVKQMATAFEVGRVAPAPGRQVVTDPVEMARRLAQNQLAEEIFRDEEDDEPEGALSKLERDALIGQGMDYELRGQIPEAISCYVKAINGGLRMPAAFFTLGLLYRDGGSQDKARRAYAYAAKDPAYRQAIKAIFSSD